MATPAAWLSEELTHAVVGHRLSAWHAAVECRLPLTDLTAAVEARGTTIVARLLAEGTLQRSAVTAVDLPRQVAACGLADAARCLDLLPDDDALAVRMGAVCPPKVLSASRRVHAHPADWATAALLPSPEATALLRLLTSAPPSGPGLCESEVFASVATPQVNHRMPLPRRTLLSLLSPLTPQDVRKPPTARLKRSREDDGD